MDDAVRIANEFLDSLEEHIPDNYKTRLCTFYPKGNCKFGSTCNFAHGYSELRQTMLLSNILYKHEMREKILKK